MKIAIWDSESESILNFVQVSEVFSDVLLYDSIEDLNDAPSEQVDLIVFDYDSDKKSIDKFLKKFRKEHEESKVLILSNALTPKQLVKHQNSKSGADIYLRTPVTLDLLKSIFEPFFDISIDGESSGVIPSTPALSQEEKVVQSQIISDHESDSEMTEEAQAISNGIQDKFNVLFSEDVNEEDNELSLEDETGSLTLGEENEDIIFSDDDALSLVDDNYEEDELCLMMKKYHLLLKMT